MIYACVLLCAFIPFAYTLEPEQYFTDNEAKEVFTLEEIKCTEQKKFLVNINHKAIIINGKLSIQFPREEFKVFTYKNTKDVDFFISETYVNFQGRMLSDRIYENLKPISQIFHTRILGVAVLKVEKDISPYDTILTQCQTFLPRNENDSFKFPIEVRNKILHLAESCLNIELAVKIGRLLPKDFPKITDFNNFEPHSVDLNHKNGNSCPSHSITEEKKKLDSMQLALNTIVDVAFIELKTILKERKMEIIEIPNIFQKYDAFNDTYIKMSGYFLGENITFEDLSTVKRTSEVVIDQRNQKLSISFGFGLDRAKIHLGYYEAKFVVFSMRGSILASVKNIDADIKLSMDFNKKQCKTSLDDFRFSQFDDLLVNISGNKIISPLASKIITSIINKWRTKIAEFIETAIGELVTSELDEFNCETYRSALNPEY
ncbi:uncharacterized protein LOC122498346 isoform X1 [Leptopilina heterotoma]|uniref:uncharacterized protein LOC122498346 isoform X1 n=1 Tax=Leptopilina heterotoma TaxID=63436 RepID=UPI001CA88E79|nr:uncharacterized protein LOC122498346 isoform X1 [Leptopilina heterotoma]